LPHPTFLPFAELFEAFATFAAFASLHFYPYFIFSLLKSNKPIEWKIKQTIRYANIANVANASNASNAPKWICIKPPILSQY